MSGKDKQIQFCFDLFNNDNDTDYKSNYRTNYNVRIYNNR